MSDTDGYNPSEHIEITSSSMVKQPLHMALVYECWRLVVGHHGRGQHLLTNPAHLLKGWPLKTNQPLALALSLSLFLFLSPSVCLSLSLCLSPVLCLCLYLSVSVSLSLSLFLSPCHAPYLNLESVINWLSR